MIPHRIGPGNAARPSHRPELSPLCPHAAPPRLAGIANPLLPDDPQLYGASPCQRAELVSAFATLGHACEVRIAERDGSYAELPRLRLALADAEDELLRLRHHVAELETLIDCLGSAGMRRKLQRMTRGVAR